MLSCGPDPYTGSVALPPTIPTSFVPKQPVTVTKKRMSGANPFLMLSYFILGVAVVGCLVLFGFEYYLNSVAARKAAEVTSAQNNIDQATVTQFIRLRDRFTAAKAVLNNHVELSQFFDLLESITLQGVRYNSLSVTVTDSRTAQVQLAGAARSFNTLAGESSAFAAQGRIKRAIFSGINSNPKDGTVTFSLTADLDPTLVVTSTAPASAPAPAANGTASAPATTTTP